jgi:N-acetylneuraminate synthase/UDP-hydrolysing UDP-N-acetyl-D-glucosamine 2-epimerase
MKKKICFITGSRAEYGLLYWLMKEVKGEPSFQFQLVVTGAHLSEQFGSTYKTIEEDGFAIDRKIPILSSDNTSLGVAEALARATAEFARAYSELQPKLIVVLGDRYEILGAVQAALILKIPIAHIAGGDITEGAFDDAIRHSITKMSHLHFVTNETSACRVAQLGENPHTIFNVGHVGLDALNQMKFLSRQEIESKLGFKLQKKNLLITFHPVTLDEEPAKKQFEELLKALDSVDAGLIFTKSNADPESAEIHELMDQFVASHKNAKAFASLGQQLYLSTLRAADVVVGNSSSGVYEAPSFRKPTVNIGDRQKGRLFSDSVICCNPEKNDILSAIQSALAKDCSKVVNPYGGPGASKQIFEILKQIQNPKDLIKKSFFDLRDLCSKSVFIIAEAGVNHNGSVETAKKLIEAAAHAGADAVKFQTFRADLIADKHVAKADYQKAATDLEETQWEMLKKLELNERAHLELQAHARKYNIEFLSTPFDEASVDLLAEKMKLNKLKVPSGEITNAPLLLKIARTGLSLIVSTGMATLEEIEQALGVIAFGYLFSKETPTTKAFREAFRSKKGKEVLREKITLLHCTTEYPAPDNEINLRAMNTLASHFGLRVGLSDHSMGIAVSIAAVARGASVIEKHFTLDRNLPGPDHGASLEPKELQSLVEGIRQVERALGDYEKKPTPSELKNKSLARKSLVARRNIQKGEKFTEECFAAKRPGSGISPMFYWELLGRPADRDYKQDEMVKS